MVLVGKKAPDFTAEAVVNKEFKKITLSSYQNKNWVVLFFYPLDFTFVCPTEITSFSDSYEEFKNRNTEILGVSTDSIYSHLAWINTPRSEGGLGDLNYPLISDFTKKIAETYDVLLPEGMSLRATFIIDPDGIVQYEMVHSNNVGRNINEILRAIDALQFIKKHGVVCPANWTKGKDTMTPDPEKKLDFFKKYSKGHL
ncbi:MAG: peroxiredoxin [Deferribacterota bacterium]|nr:peroxiredoxin [Deferribacterota bacterium]